MEQVLTRSQLLSVRLKQLSNRFHLWQASFAKAADGFVSQPEPRTIGSFAKGRQLTAGNFLLAGFLVEAPDRSIWDLPMPDLRVRGRIARFHLAG